MAVTITRTARIDDDGTGTTGTVINNAEKTTLYNEIDTALAKVAQLAGGNTFTGTQTMPTVNSAGVLQLATNNAERMRVTATGEVWIGTTAPPPALGTPVVAVAITNPAAGPGMLMQNLSATLVNYVLFGNNAGALAGYINQGSATTVGYNTSSDARLKEDAGRASDLAALRGVVVHDFTWKADGVRDRGVFAQEAHALYPRAVSPGTDATTADGSLACPWMTDYSKFVPDLIVGWQQHDAELTELRAILAAVKG